MLMIKCSEIIMKKVQSTLFQSWGTKVSSTSKTNLIDEIGDEDIADLDDADLDDETLLAACQEWDSSSKSKNTIVQGTPLENLPGFDMSSGHIWIYPTNMPVRHYQMNIVEQSLLKNTLVTLPTGLGKTFIAAVVMYNFYRWYPSGKIVFMAPTKPLVAQQIEACYNIMGIPQNHTAEMTGSMHPPERKRVWQSRRVFFLTPQVLMNDLSRKACPADEIKCLVVDEAHKALGNHSYCQVVRELSKYTINFRVLALSATPGSDLKAVQQVLTNLMIAHIEIRSEEAPDIQKYVHNRKIDKYVVPLGKELEAIQEKYLRIITVYVDKLYRTKCLYSRNPKSLTKYQVLMCRDAFRKDPPDHMQRAQLGVAEGEFAILISLYHGYELLLQHGMHSLHCFLTSMVDGSKGTSRARNELMQNHGFSDLMGELERKFKVETEETELANRSFSSSIVKTLKRPFVYSHPKLKKLEEVVLEHFDQYKSENGCSSGGKMNTRVMIFTQYRDSVNEISTMLNQHKPTIKCMPFVGQSSAGKSTKGVTQKEQLRVVREFRAGGYNTIVSTCVGEEGLDIGEVDLIVCYDVHKSPIRLVQRMGRTGRKRHGRIVMLVTEGKEETVYNQGFYNNKGIQKALHGNTKNLQLYHNNPRMVPKGLNPKVHQMYLTVASAYKNKNDMKSARSSSKINNQTGHGPKQKNDAFLSEEELRFWNLHYKLDDHQKASVKTIPSGGRFITIGDKTSKKKQKTLSSEFSLSEWSLWQTKKQPFKFVDHSKRCKNFVEVEEFMEVQGFVEGEDVYGMEMATFLNKDDIVKKKKSRIGIQRFCVNEQLDSNDASTKDNTSGEKDGRTESDVSESKSKKGTSCTIGNQDKSVSLSDLIHDIDVNQERGDGISKNKEFVIDNSESASTSKEELVLQKKSGGKRKKKTKHLTPVQYSDDDDFEFKGDLLKSKANDRHKEKNDMSEGLSPIDNALIHKNGKVLVPDVILRKCKSPEVEELDETLPPYDLSHKEPSPNGQHDNDQHNYQQIDDQYTEDHHTHDQYDDDKHDDLSVIFPCTQARTEKRSQPFADEISSKTSFPPAAPNISSLDFLDDIDDLELSHQLSIQPIADHLQSSDKPFKKLDDICETSYRNQSDEATKGERMTGRCRVSEGISIIQVNPSKSISGEWSSADIIDKEITEMENYVDSVWEFDWSDVEDEKINQSTKKEGTAGEARSTHQRDKQISSDSIAKVKEPCIHTSPKHGINQIDNRELLDKCRTKVCILSKSVNKDGLSKEFLESNGSMNILIDSEICSSKAVQQRTLPEQKRTLPEQKRMLPGQKGTMLEQNIALQEQKTLSEQKMTLLEENIMLPELKRTSSEYKKMLKEQKRTSPDQRKTLPEKVRTSPEQSQGFSPCLFSENFISNRTVGIEELYPQLESKNQELEKDENRRIVIDENIETKYDSTYKKFDLQFDLDDFLNDDDDDDEEDNDDDIIPPTPAKFNNLSGRSQPSQLLLGKIHVKPVNQKLQKNVDELESRSIFDSKSSTPKPLLLKAIPSKVSVASAKFSCDTVYSDSCKTSSLSTLQSSTDSTNFRRNSSLTHSKLQSGGKGLNFLTASSDAPDAKKQVKCIAQTSMLFYEKEDHKESDVESKGIKRKSDSFSSWKYDSQKKRKVLKKDLVVHRTSEDKSDFATKGPKAQLLGKNYEEDDEIGDDSEDEIQTKRRNKKNVLSSPVFKTPIKPAKRSKFIVVSSDSDDDKISSNELPSPLGERLLKKSGLSSGLLDNFKNDEDFQDFADVHKKLTTPAHRKRIEANSRIIKHRRDKNPTFDLLDLEADVESGADCSSDEADASQVDQSILDFINDNTVCSPGADLQAVYLQSLRDSDNLKVNNRFRLAPRSHIDDEEIFSQVPQQDEDYGDDSFVVYEENDVKTKEDTNMFDMTINPDNIITTKTRRGKRLEHPKIQANIDEMKKGKRKRVITYDSSSEEESIMKDHQDVNCTEKISLGRNQNTTGECPPKQSHPVIDTKIRKVDEPLKVFECVSSRNSVTHNNERLSCDSTVGKTQEQIAREERLKRQREKQLEFRRKMAEKERKFEEAKISVKILNTHFQPQSTKTDEQTSSASEKDLSIRNNLKLVGINLEQSRNDRTIHSSNDQRTGLTVCQKTVATISHMTNKSDTLREEYGLSQKSQRCDGQPVVLVDPGVLSSCPHIASTLELQHNLNSNVHQLSACDFMVSSRMGVIRKSISDFANGANRNKLVDQVRHIFQLCDRPCLIVEANRLKKPDEKRHLTRTKYLDRTIAQLIKTHIKLLFTDSTDETASVLADLTRMESRKGFTIQIPKERTEKQEQIFKICLSIPCLNFAGALCLSNSCSTFAEVVSSTPSQLEIKARISASRAQELYQFFKHKFNSEMLAST